MNWIYFQLIPRYIVLTLLHVPATKIVIKKFGLFKIFFLQ